jgi:hypothetical protein
MSIQAVILSFIQGGLAVVIYDNISGFGIRPARADLGLFIHEGGAALLYTLATVASRPLYSLRGLLITVRIWSMTTPS